MMIYALYEFGFEREIQIFFHVLYKFWVNIRVFLWMEMKTVMYGISCVFIALN